MATNIDSQLWYGIAGKLVKLPLVNSQVIYFPQGHAEHAADGPVDFNKYLDIPSCITCKVSFVNLLASTKDDEIYAKIGLTPVDATDDVSVNDDDNLEHNNNQRQLLSFSKTLTQSDANNVCGFSIPKPGAESLFPSLYSKEDPPLRILSMKDVHGKIYTFRHVFRGTPRRHLLTTGWNIFVNDKKLNADDCVMFLKRGNSELCVATRHQKKTVKAGEKELGLGKLASESVLQAARLAADGKPFEVDFYPGRGLPEFFVRSDVVRSALQFNWRCGMRVKMPYEVKNCVEPSWARGTISSVEAVDPIRWPNSKWRSIQARMDEPEVVLNETSFNPWAVEAISDKHQIDLSYVNPPRGKKLKTLPRELPRVDPLPGQQANLFNYPYMMSCSSGNIHACEASSSQLAHRQVGPVSPYIAPSIQKNSTCPNGSISRSSSPESTIEKDSGLPISVNVDASPPQSEKKKKTCFKLFGVEIHV